MEFLRKIRTLDGYRETPVIAVSMRETSSIEFEDLVQGFLVKGFGSNDLLEALKHAGLPISLETAVQ